jgi:hypothetical protein
MARHQSDREDLLREATALTWRVELQVDGFVEPIVIGIRSQGAASVFFGQDPVYHFTAAGQLRRAYCQGRLYKALARRLISLERQRDESRVVLSRRELDSIQTVAFQQEVGHHLRQLQQALTSGRFQLTGQVPSDQDVLQRVREWLDQLDPRIPVAKSPNVQ